MMNLVSVRKATERHRRLEWWKKMQLWHIKEMERKAWKGHVYEVQHHGEMLQYYTRAIERRLVQEAEKVAKRGAAA